MAGYLGQKPAVNGIYTVDEFTSSGGTTYTLSRAPGSKNNIQVNAGGLAQYPSAYSVSGTTLTLSGVPSGQKVVVRHMGETILYPNLDDGIVTDAKLAGTLNLSSKTVTLPAASVTAHASDYIAWQAVVTAATLTAVAGRGYPINTTSNACTVTLPASASAGDTIKFVDYARTWQTNAVTINPNSIKFQGYLTPQPVFDTQGQSVTIVYIDATQGWIPISDKDVEYETAQAITATGGTIITYTYLSVDYKVHKFLTTGATNCVIISVPSGQTIDVLVVAGGGGGSAGIHSTTNGGAGGAGGYRWFTAQTPTTSTYVATVGAGGAGGGSGTGAKGNNSSFIGTGISITATGGGYGGYSQAAGGAGGSGGGSSGNSAVGGAGNQGSYTPVEGYSGNPTAGHNSAGSGGGGMGAVGVISTSSNGGAGGNGVNNFLNQSSTAFTTAHTKALLDAVNIGEVSSGTRYIGGGGTGGNLGGTSYGGLGGGGDSPADGIGTTGDVNTGSGGAGNGHTQTTNANGHGGSGMILVRYLA